MPVILRARARRGEVTDLEPISVEDYIEAKAADPWCQVMATKVDEGQGGRFKRDDRGLLVRIAPLDLSELVLVSPALRPRVLHRAHYPRLVCHPGTTRMYQSLRPSSTGRPWLWTSSAQCDHAPLVQRSGSSSAATAAGSSFSQQRVLWSSPPSTSYPFARKNMGSNTC